MELNASKKPAIAATRTAGKSVPKSIRKVSTNIK